MIKKHNSDFGQLLAVGAFTIAVLLIALAFNLNSNAYTNYKAVDSMNPTADKVDNYITEQELLITKQLSLVGRETGENYPQLQTKVESMNTELNENISKKYQQRGITTESAYQSTTQGLLLYQLTESNLVDKDDNPNWILVRDIEQFNKFRFNVDTTSLTTRSDPDQADTFHLIISDDDGSVNYRIYVYKESNDTIKIETRDASSTIQYSCSTTPSTETSLNLYAETLDSKGCEALSVIDTLDRISIQNGNKLEGTFIFKGAGNMNDKTQSVYYESDTSSAYPQRSKIIYSATVLLEYADADAELSQEKTVTVGDIYDI